MGFSSYGIKEILIPCSEYGAMVSGKVDAIKKAESEGMASVIEKGAEVSFFTKTCSVRFRPSSTGPKSSIAGYRAIEPSMA